MEPSELKNGELEEMFQRGEKVSEKEEGAAERGAQTVAGGLVLWFQQTKSQRNW